jgi:magnesium chelatase subunit H
MLAEAALLAAQADEPDWTRTPVRAHALPMPNAMIATMETPRCASSPTPMAPMAPTSTIWSKSGAWDDEDELAETYSAARALPMARSGKPVQQGRAAAVDAGRC